MQTASTILMVRPAAFGFNAQTAANNTFQGFVDGLSEDETNNKALTEFDGFVAALREKGVEVIVVEDTPKPVKPDAIFPNNWFCTLPNGTVTIFPMWSENRSIEVREDIISQLVKEWEYTLTDLRNTTGAILEGTGSMVIDHDAKIIYACLSPRTDKGLLEQFAASNGYTSICFTSLNEQGVPIYHTNVMMHIGEGYAVVCASSIANEKERQRVIASLATKHEIIDISFEQMNNYAGNMLQVHSKDGEGILVMSVSAYNALSARQLQCLQYHTQILQVSIPVIETIGGGSARCMMAEIF